MDFLRKSFLPWEGTGETHPDRFVGEGNASSLGKARFSMDRRMNAHIRIDRESQLTRAAAASDAQLHAALRDVPLPAGFMGRMREFVSQGLEVSE